MAKPVERTIIKFFYGVTKDNPIGDIFPSFYYAEEEATDDTNDDE